jgi:hypothetical protein
MGKLWPNPCCILRLNDQGSFHLTTECNGGVILGFMQDGSDGGVRSIIFTFFYKIYVYVNLSSPSSLHACTFTTYKLLNSLIYIYIYIYILSIFFVFHCKESRIYLYLYLYIYIYIYIYIHTHTHTHLGLGFMAI